MWGGVLTASPNVAWVCDIHEESSWLSRHLPVLVLLQGHVTSLTPVASYRWLTARVLDCEGMCHPRGRLHAACSVLADGLAQASVSVLRGNVASSRPVACDWLSTASASMTAACAGLRGMLHRRGSSPRRRLGRRLTTHELTHNQSVPAVCLTPVQRVPAHRLPRRESEGEKLGVTFALSLIHI